MRALFGGLMGALIGAWLPVFIGTTADVSTIATFVIIIGCVGAAIMELLPKLHKR